MSSMLSTTVDAQALEVDCASERSIFAETIRPSTTPPSANSRIATASVVIFPASVDRNRMARFFTAAPQDRVHRFPEIDRHVSDTMPSSIPAARPDKDGKQTESVLGTVAQNR
jgi:hypothetical protein